MSLLCLDSGGRLVTQDELRQEEVPPGTSTHQPIPHAWFADEVKQNFQAAGLTITQEEHGLAHEGQRYFGIYCFSTNGGYPDYTLLCGLRNSHDKSFSAAVSWGSKVFVCDNLAFVGDVVLARKHTRHIMDDLPERIANVVQEFKPFQIRQEERFQAYKAKTGLCEAHVHDVVCKAVKVGVLSSQQILPVLTHNDNRFDRGQGVSQPLSPEEIDHDTSLWGLFNDFTYVLSRKVRTVDLPHRTMLLQDKVLDPYFGIAV